MTKRHPGREAQGVEGTAQSLPCDNATLLLPKKTQSQRTVLDTDDRRDITPIYRAIVAEGIRHLLAMNIPLDKASEFCGLPDRYLNKALNPDSFSGRQMSWPSLQTFLDLACPDGLDLRIRRKAGPRFDALSLKYATRYDKAFAKAKTRREILAEWGRRGGLKQLELPPEKRTKIGRRLARARNKKLSKQMRSELASRAARSRWANRKSEPKP